ncbi:MAG: ATP-binding protein [Bryobacteraceae bacterium]
MVNPIIGIGISLATLRILTARGLPVTEISIDKLGKAIQADPAAVLVIEGDMDGIQVESDSVKVIQIAGEAPADRGVGDALRSHLFGLFHRPLDEGLLVETIEEAQALESWSDGIEVLSARPNWLTLRVRCRQYTADRLVRFIRELVADLDPSDRDNIGIAFREILLNAMEHGAAFDSSKYIHVSYLRAQRFIMYTVCDPGSGFSLDDLPHAAISNPPEDPIRHLLHRAEHGLRAGGFGLMVTKDLVDEMHYNEVGNEVVLIKYL